VNATVPSVQVPSIHAHRPMLVPLRAIPAGSLAPWQARRLHSYIETNLSQRLDLETLARCVNLSSGHLSHSFKRTFGTTVHSYVMHRRVMRAQHLMLNTSMGLSSIALTCGMSDQAHLTRWFARVIGETPGAFRRARFEPAPLGAPLSTAPISQTGS
jgi:AraC family transcriptional regulator